MVCNHCSAGQKAEADQAVAQAFYGCGLPFSLVADTLFKDMLKAVGRYGAAYAPPNINQLREGLLVAEKRRLEAEVTEVMFRKLDLHGYSLCSDGWSDPLNRPLLNALAVNNKGSLFLKATDTKGETKVRLEGIYELDAHCYAFAGQQCSPGLVQPRQH